MITSFAEIYQKLEHQAPKKVSLVGAGEAKLIQVLEQAFQRGFIKGGVLIGQEKRIREVLKKIKPKANFEVIDKDDPPNQVREALCQVKQGKADLLMKGSINTSLLMKGLLDPDLGLRTNNIISQITIHQLPDRKRLLFITDSGINIEPDLGQKQKIMENAIALAHKMEIKKPKVAILSFTEQVKAGIKSSREAAILTQIAQRGQIKGAIVDGPLSLDLAIDPQSAKTKNINSPVAGDADILLVANLEMGNVLSKSLSFIAKYRGLGILAGVERPVVLTSRSASVQEKLDSLALAAFLANY